MRHCNLLAVAALTCGSAAALVPAAGAVPLWRVRVHRPACAQLRSSSSSSNEDDEDEPSLPSAYDLSAELNKYTGAGLRFRQSGPIRRTGGALTGLVDSVSAFTRFLRAAVGTVPFYGGMMVALLCAFGLQSASPRAAMVGGARVNAAIRNGGQWHRLVSPVFLHGGGMHLFSNLFSLYRVGPLVEAGFGPSRAALLYLLSGIGGNVAGLFFGAAKGMSIGASGAVFGMIGASGGYVLRNKRALGTYGDAILRNAIQILALNLFIGMRSRGIDNLAHVGGFATGAVLGVLLSPAVNTAGRGRYDGPDEGTREAFVPPWLVRALLAATTVAYAAGLREATRIALAVQRVYGR